MHERFQGGSFRSVGQFSVIQGGIYLAEEDLGSVGCWAGNLSGAVSGI